MAQDPLTLPFTHSVFWVEAWGAVACVVFQSLWLPKTKKEEFGPRVVGIAMPSAVGPVDFSLLWLRNKTKQNNTFLNTNQRMYGRVAGAQ